MFLLDILVDQICSGDPFLNDESDYITLCIAKKDLKWGTKHFRHSNWRANQLIVGWNRMYRIIASIMYRYSSKSVTAVL